jgi:organic radical activating enzyme
MQEEMSPEEEIFEDIEVGEDFDPSLADDTDMSSERTKRDPLLAPYNRFRDNAKLYADSDPPGCFGAELVGCGFACRQCWSSYGLRGKDKMKWMHPDEVATRLIEGAYKNNRRLVRVTAGEPFLYPEHVIAVAERVLAHTDMTPALRLQIETNGLYATPQVMQRLNEIAADYILPPNPANPLENHQDRSRLGLWWSFKAPDASYWSWHTGRSIDEFETMGKNLMWALENASNVDIWIGLMDELCESDDFREEFAMVVEDYRPGVSRKIGYEQFTIYHPTLRAIDERMGQRRLAMAKKQGMVGQGEGWSEEEIVANGIFPPFPKPKQSIKTD